MENVSNRTWFECGECGYTYSPTVDIQDLLEEKSSFLFQFRASYYSGTTKSFQIMTDVLLI